LDKRIGAWADGLRNFFLSSLDGGCTGHVVNFNCNWANWIQENEGTESHLISAFQMYNKEKRVISVLVKPLKHQAFLLQILKLNMIVIFK